MKAGTQARQLIKRIGPGILIRRIHYITVMFRVKIAFCIILPLLIACSRKSVSSLQRKGVVVTQKKVTIRNDDAAGNALQIQYLGCGGLYIRHPGQAIMIDPFFSHQRFMKIGRSMLFGGRIRSSARQIGWAQKRLCDSIGISEEGLRKETKAVFAAHGHYDHLMDVPYIHRYWLGQQAEVYVNESAANSCAGVIPAGKLHRIEALASVREQQGKSIDLPGADGSMIRVYPILAAHNPHMRNIKLFSGSVTEPLLTFRDPLGKTNVNHWLEGRTLSFLIDIEHDNRIVYRIFVQSSSCHFPDGLPPLSLLSAKPVDLAILGVASYHFSEASYPCGYLEQLKPRHLMFIHWEDFFRPYNRPPKSVLKNDIPRFFNKVLEQCKPAGYILPAPGVVINAEY